MGVVERTRRLAVLAEETDRLDEFLVAVGDRRHLLPTSVPELDDNGVPAMDLDVLDVRHLEQGLQTAVAEHCILDRRDVGLFLGRRPQLGALAMKRPNMISDDPTDDRPAHQQPVVATQRSAGRSLLKLAFGGDLLRGPPSQLDDLHPVEAPDRQVRSGCP